MYFNKIEHLQFRSGKAKAVGINKSNISVTFMSLWICLLLLVPQVPGSKTMANFYNVKLNPN